MFSRGVGGTDQKHDEFCETFDDFADAVVVADESGTIEYANKAATDLFGDEVFRALDSARAEECGIFSADGTRIVPSDGLPLALALVGKATGEIELFVRNKLHPEGLYVSGSAFPRRNRDGKIRGATGFFRDVTANRRLVEEKDRQLDELRAKTHRCDAVFKNALDAVMLADDKMRFVDVNPSACKLLGYSRDEMLSLDVAQITAPDYRDGVADQWTAFLQGGTAEGELKLVSKDGRNIEAEFRAVANIRPSVHLSVIRDISQRKHAEANLRESQRTDSVGLMASGAAHDFNNLLVGIIGNASLALEGLAPDDQALPFLRDVLTAGERAAQLSRQMLRYAVDSGPGRELMNVSDAVREIGALIQSTIPKQVEVEYQLETVREIEADPAQVHQVIMNLIINAGQAIYEQSPGKITVRVEGRAFPDGAEQRETAELPSGEYVVIEVEDTGRGMDEAVRSRIFEPFFTTKAEGKGLGLAAVRKIVSDHGGAIWVRSALGRGSCFSVAFPVSSRASHGEFQASTEEFANHSVRILVVDNERLVQRMVKATLEKMGHKVTVLGDGRDALALLASEHGDFQAMLLDLGLPGVSAKGLALEARRLRPEMKIIPSTGHAALEASHWLEGVETADFIQKPYTATQLRRQIGRALAQCR